MNTRLFPLLLLFCLVLPASTYAEDAKGTIDWDRARNLYQRERSGEKLSPEDQAYLDHAKAERANERRAQQNAPQAPAPRESTGLAPLTTTDGPAYKGFKLGLYGEGENRPPAEHLKHAMEAAKKVTPLDSEGHSAADGKIVLMSVGMSNTTQEFSRFVQIANNDPAKNPKLVIVDAAQGGKAADSWTDKDQPTWQEADRRLKAARVTPAQVQVIWLKQARIRPAALGDFPKHAEALEADLKKTVLTARERYPNLKLVYLSSRTYGGYARTALNPEPYAYESGFSVQWLIRSQIAGKDPDLGYDKAPVLLWGPYLWTDGTKGRAIDSLVWQKEDTGPDGTHPSDSGRGKIADLLLGFFKTDPTSKILFRQ